MWQSVRLEVSSDTKDFKNGTHCLPAWVSASKGQNWEVTNPPGNGSNAKEV